MNDNELAGAIDEERIGLIDEISDADLELVMGGLSRAWVPESPGWSEGERRVA